MQHRPQTFLVSTYLSVASSLVFISLTASRNQQQQKQDQTHGRHEHQQADHSRTELSGQLHQEEQGCQQDQERPLLQPPCDQKVPATFVDAICLSGGQNHVRQRPSVNCVLLLCCQKESSLLLSSPVCSDQQHEVVVPQQEEQVQQHPLEVLRRQQCLVQSAQQENVWGRLFATFLSLSFGNFCHAQL